MSCKEEISFITLKLKSTFSTCIWKMSDKLLQAKLTSRWHFPLQEVYYISLLALDAIKRVSKITKAVYKNRKRGGIYCILYASFCRKSPVHTYLEPETGDALFTYERINRQGNFSAALRKEAWESEQCALWRCLTKQGQCSEATLEPYTHSSNRQL